MPVALFAASGKVQLAVTVATAVVFIVWFHRARVNAGVFAPNCHAMKHGWAIWGWVVPVVNLWSPGGWPSSPGTPVPTRTPGPGCCSTGGGHCSS
ncbi:DUF4328 domain-containing protein [Streptomyces sp. NPDC048644]|uniref:DUF4328 domain-containing protein n=1 Tax=Streptomyces sp. NPDC048644 TaxID=3365582 RepID=UPI003711CBEE